MSVRRVLYYAPRSGPSRSVLLTARALNIDLQLKLTLNDKGENRTPEFLKMNPQHTVPVLDDNGTVVVDSHAICAYLSEKYAKNDLLYPKDLGKRGVVDARMHFDSCALFARIRSICEPILYDKSPELPQEKIEYVQRSWAIMESFLENSPFVCGDQLTIADFCCATSVTSINEIAPIDSDRYPKFVAWLDRMRQLPYFDEVNAEGAAQLQATLLARLKANRELAEASTK